MIAGIFTLYAGPLIVLAGAICLAVYAWRAFRNRSVPGVRLFWQIAGTAALLAANFVAAGAIVMAAIDIETRYVVTVVNNSDTPLEAARLEGGGVDAALGAVGPGQDARREFHVGFDGELRLHGRVGSHAVDEVLDSYITNGVGNDLIVTVQADGSIMVEQRWRAPGGTPSEEPGQ
jgi:hypothetical protein